MPHWAEHGVILANLVPDCVLRHHWHTWPMFGKFSVFFNPIRQSEVYELYHMMLILHTHVLEEQDVGIPWVLSFTPAVHSSQPVTQSLSCHGPNYRFSPQKSTHTTDGTPEYT